MWLKVPAWVYPQVTLSGGEGQPAKVVGYDEDKDVAVLQIDAKGMEVAAGKLGGEPWVACLLPLGHRDGPGSWAAAGASLAGSKQPSILPSPPRIAPAPHATLFALQGPLVPLRLGESSDLEVGQKVFAIGNPFGLDHTLTAGATAGAGESVFVQ
jgi:S1-C subfamily serine protease